MNYSHLLSMVPEIWHEQFVHFVSSGDASEEFLAFLDKDPKTQEAVEMAFTAQVRSFEKFARHLNADVETISAALRRRPVPVAKKSAEPANAPVDFEAVRAAAEQDPAFHAALRQLVNKLDANKVEMEVVTQ
jgi:hypothetical protein